MCSLSDNQNILDLLDYFFKTTKDYLNHDHPNAGYVIYYQYNKGRATFMSFFLLVCDLRLCLKVKIHYI
jgi:hypothetical protein